MNQWFAILSLAIATCLSPAQTTAPPDDIKDQLADLARDLSHPSYSVRVSTTRRLYEIGPAAGDVLRELAQGADMEAALRARRILSDLERVYFSGVELSLAFSESHTQWDKPVDLIVTLTNRSEFSAKIPVEETTPSEAAPSGHAQQVGTMLDLADWLIVRNDQGEVVSFHLDDILADPAVTAVVQRRAETGSSTTLPPGEQATVTLIAFNRGWARYRLLDRGVYKVVLEYAPKWNDPLLNERRIGFVESNQATLIVDNDAPVGVARGRAEAELTVERDGPTLIARIANRTDLPMIINTNFGADPPFARGNWVYSCGPDVREVPVAGLFDGGVKDLKEDLLIEVAPGSSTAVARTTVTRLRQELVDAGANLSAGPWSIHFSYLNDWSSHRRTDAADSWNGLNLSSDVLRDNLFRWVLSARHNSNRILSPSLDVEPPFRDP